MKIEIGARTLYGGGIRNIMNISNASEESDSQYLALASQPAGEQAHFLAAGLLSEVRLMLSEQEGRACAKIDGLKDWLGIDKRCHVAVYLNSKGYSLKTLDGLSKLSTIARGTSLRKARMSIARMTGRLYWERQPYHPLLSQQTRRCGSAQ